MSNSFEVQTTVCDHDIASALSDDGELFSGVLVELEHITNRQLDDMTSYLDEAARTTVRNLFAAIEKSMERTAL